MPDMSLSRLFSHLTQASPAVRDLQEPGRTRAVARLCRAAGRACLNQGLSLGLVLGLAACAGAPPAPVLPPDAVLHDQAFTRPAALPQPDAVFAVSPAMTRYVQETAQGLLRRQGLDHGLVEALYSRRQLQLEYDSERTRTATEAFDARAGNCLSLAIMTGALAGELGLQVRYQTVDVESTWERSGALLLRNNHINVSLRRPLQPQVVSSTGEWLTVDFLPPQSIERLKVHEVSRERVVAMFMNNRAAEELAQERPEAAYWWAREAVQQDAAFADAYNTLAVIYRRHGQPAWAEAALRRTLALRPDSLIALDNLAGLLEQQGRSAEAAPLRERLAQLQPSAPFTFFDEGMAALQRGDYARARDLLEREVARSNDYHEVHMGLAVAYMNLGNTAAAARHLELARENVGSRKRKAIYAAKLEQLKALAAH